MSELNPKRRETHPGWGGKIGVYTLLSLSSKELSKWYETGDSITEHNGWAKSHIYTKSPFPPASGQKSVSFAMDFDKSITSDTTAPTAGSVFQMKTQWAAFKEGTQATLQRSPNSEHWDEIYQISEGTCTNGTWSTSGDPFAVLCIRKGTGKLVWWVLADADLSSAPPTTDQLTVTGAKTSLVFVKQDTMLKEEAPTGMAWFHLGDDPEA